MGTGIGGILAILTLFAVAKGFRGRVMPVRALASSCVGMALAGHASLEAENRGVIVSSYLADSGAAIAAGLFSWLVAVAVGVPLVALARRRD